MYFMRLFETNIPSCIKPPLEIEMCLLTNVLMCGFFVYVDDEDDIIMAVVVVVVGVMVVVVVIVKGSKCAKYFIVGILMIFCVYYGVTFLLYVLSILFFLFLFYFIFLSRTEEDVFEEGFF